MTTLYKFDDARLLASILNGEGTYLGPAAGALGKPLLPAGVEIPPLANESRGSGILHGAVHGSHHLGQIITMRQLLGLWPPPAGSMTW